MVEHDVRWGRYLRETSEFDDKKKEVRFVGGWVLATVVYVSSSSSAIGFLFSLNLLELELVCSFVVSSMLTRRALLRNMKFLRNGDRLVLLVSTWPGASIEAAATFGAGNGRIEV